MNVIAGIAITLGKALAPEFKTYAAQVLANARRLGAELAARGVSLITGGTDNHMLVANTQASFGLDGRTAEELLDEAGLTTNKQIIPDDPNPPLRPSGIRLGTPAATTRGMGEAEMVKLAGWIAEVLASPSDAAKRAAVRAEVAQLCGRFPVPGLE
jgi:glycine hydroxymethyltransferase